jgi:hypothetical protein
MTLYQYQSTSTTLQSCTYGYTGDLMTQFCLTVPNQISIEIVWLCQTKFPLKLEQNETRACGEGHVVGQTQLSKFFFLELKAVPCQQALLIECQDKLCRIEQWALFIDFVPILLHKFLLH